jgi:ribonuclease HIII
MKISSGKSAKCLVLHTKQYNTFIKKTRSTNIVQFGLLNRSITLTIDTPHADLPKLRRNEINKLQK